MDRTRKRILIFFAGRNRNARGNDQRPGLIAARALDPEHVIVLYPEDDAVAKGIARELVEDIANDGHFKQAYWPHRVVMTAVPSGGDELAWRKLEPCHELIQAWLDGALNDRGELVFEREKAADVDPERGQIEAFSLAEEFTWSICGLSGTLAAQVALTRALEQLGANIEVVYSPVDRKLAPTTYRPEARGGAKRGWRDQLDRMRHLPVSSLLLLRGETGVGKSFGAGRLHKLWFPHGEQKNGSGKFVHINCAAIPSTLLEAELFGSRKGAFTGAVDKKGAFVSAHGGTLFLDEIGALEPALQAKLLVVLDTDGSTRAVTPVGGGGVEHTDARILLGTNQDLEAMVEEGLFREDLLARVRDHVVTLPPLRERRHELIEAFTRQLELQLERYKKNPLLAGVEVVVVSHVVRRYLEQLFMDARNIFPHNHRTVRALAERAMFEAASRRIEELERGGAHAARQKEDAGETLQDHRRLDFGESFIDVLATIASSLLTRTEPSSRVTFTDAARENWLDAAREQRLIDTMGQERFDESSTLERLEAALLLEAYEQEGYYNRAWDRLEREGWVRATESPNKSDVFRKRYHQLFGDYPSKP